MSDLFKTLADDMPGVTIETEGIPFSSIRSTLLTRLRGGAGPDMFLASASYISSLMDGGYLQPLDGLVPPESIEGLRPVNTEQGRFEDAQVAYLSEVAVYGFAFNVDILKEAGVGVPTNIDELVEYSIAVTEKTDHFGFTAPNMASESSAWHHAFGTFAAGFGGGLSDGENITLDTPENLEALKAYAALYPTMPIGATTADRQAMFSAGLIAGYLTNNPTLAAMIADSDAEEFEVAVVNLLPEPAAVSASQWLAINSESEHKEIAAEIMRKFLSKEFQEKWIAVLGGGSTTATDVEVPQSALDENPWIEEWNVMTPEDRLLPPYIRGFGIESPEIETVLFEELEKVMIAGKDPAQALADAQAAAEEIVGK